MPGPHRRLHDRGARDDRVPQADCGDAVLGADRIDRHGRHAPADPGDRLERAPRP